MVKVKTSYNHRNVTVLDDLSPHLVIQGKKS